MTPALGAGPAGSLPRLPAVFFLAGEAISQGDGQAAQGPGEMW
jgi:hypothetical protein